MGRAAWRTLHSVGQKHQALPVLHRPDPGESPGCGPGSFAPDRWLGTKNASAGRGARSGSIPPCGSHREGTAAAAGALGVRITNAEAAFVQVVVVIDLHAIE